ncbi:conserved hypothetical protein [Coccidioides posadasii str. Silveira]|uniref:Uncharacterized protein n=1 Tax=Coccidioides posadasii (strain RMSCC 757 / Silveira) TaxID=443226 RepID=E9CRI5_COCPS|nr:conserved hypothetical protein [Coccidioides posadasii str. Silveira]
MRYSRLLLLSFCVSPLGSLSALLPTRDSKTYFGKVIPLLANPLRTFERLRTKNCLNSWVCLTSSGAAMRAKRQDDESGITPVCTFPIMEPEKPEKRDEIGSTKKTPGKEEKKCFGLGSRKYVTRYIIKDIIEDEFCTEAFGQGEPDKKSCTIRGVLDKGSGSVARTYLKGTPEEVDIAMDWKPGLGPEMNVTECRHKFIGQIIDGCDGNDKNNPLNWKGGGWFKSGGIKYRVTPKIVRQPARKKPWAGCSFYRGSNWYHGGVKIWGGGFSSGDWGKRVKDTIEQCHRLEILKKGGKKRAKIPGKGVGKGVGKGIGKGAAGDGGEDGEGDEGRYKAGYRILDESWKLKYYLDGGELEWFLCNVVCIAPKLHTLRC